jgi:hypothetical protein
MNLHALIEDLPQEDSPDLTDDEIVVAVPTENKDELTQAMVDAIKHHMGSSFEVHELRRRGEHLYMRSKMRTDREPNKTLIFRVDWLGRSAR